MAPAQPVDPRDVQQGEDDLGDELRAQPDRVGDIDRAHPRLAAGGGEPLHNGEVLLLSREELRNLHPVDALGQIGVIVGILVGLALPGLPLPRF